MYLFSFDRTNTNRDKNEEKREREEEKNYNSIYIANIRANVKTLLKIFCDTLSIDILQGRKIFFIITIKTTFQRSKFTWNMVLIRGNTRLKYFLTIVFMGAYDSVFFYSSKIL